MSGMHLLPVYYTTTNQKKRKKKKINPAKYEAEWRKYNKFLKSLRSPVMTLDEYIDYRHGKYKSKSEKCYGSTAVSKTASWGSTPCSDANSYRRETKDYPSLSNRVPVGVATKKTYPVYTGNAVIGQAYNKGGLQVLSASEANDPSTGKRR